MHLRVGLPMLLLCAAALLPASSIAQTPAFAPRGITDILRLLESHRSDPVQIASFRERLSAVPAKEASWLEAARFYQERATAAQRLGDALSAHADYQRGLDLVRGSGNAIEGQLVQSLASSTQTLGHFADSIRLLESLRSPSLYPGRAITLESDLVFRLAYIGDRAGARAAMANTRAAHAGIMRLRATNVVVRTMAPWYDGVLQLTTAFMAQLEDQPDQAEQSFRQAIATFEKDVESARERVRRQLFPDAHTAENHPLFSINNLDRAELAYAQFLIDRERGSEAEIATRNVFVRTLARSGRYHPGTAHALRSLAAVLYDQGRYADAAALARLAEGALLRAGVAPHSTVLAEARKVIAQSLAAQRLWADAAAAFAAMRDGLASHPDALNPVQIANLDWALSLIETGKPVEGAAMANTLVQRLRESRGNEHLLTGLARGGLGLALFRAGDTTRAAAEFEAAVRIIAQPASGDSEGSPARVRQIQAVLEGYIELLFAQGDTARAFRLADMARGQSVQRALTASAARAALSDPAIASLARREQDLGQELRSLYAFLGNMLVAPPEQRLPKVEADMRQRIDTIRRERQVLIAETTRRFPRYAELVSPPAPDVNAARKALRPGETLISILVAPARTFVWALPQDGALLSASVNLPASEAARIVDALRTALEPGEAPLERFPAFDVKLAHTLYAQLLGPVESALRGRHTLIVSANGALGRLPFAVLSTTPGPLPRTEQLFAQYRAVNWLGRSHGIAHVPSVASLVALRALAPLDLARTPLSGFGDPVFDRSQLASTARATGHGTTRAVRLAARSGTLSAGTDWARYEELAPLPDTRDELLAIAKTLGASAAGLHLGAAATPRKVKSSDLSRSRVVAFATHGLVPGDLPGLEAPALALAPSEDPKESPLLTLEDVLGLKLNADWVVLSACNTAAGDGEGAEAVSGLGRGFFYAGTRALLVTHWPVESRSARLLVTRLFERYASSEPATRAEALRYAIAAVMDDQASDADGKPLYSYAHPFFWAPYALVGDAGR
jgi:CHAT domain-containing protein/tetratricopeptide (TPR) repeat protein